MLRYLFAKLGQVCAALSGGLDGVQTLRQRLAHNRSSYLDSKGVGNEAEHPLHSVN